MSDFRKRIRVEVGDMQDIPAYSNDRSKSGKKVAIERLSRILAEQMAYVRENTSFSKEEQLEQGTVFLRMFQILQNYDELEPVLIKYFAEKAEKEKWNR